MLLTPFSSAHPHLLNLNQGWDARPFISSVSSGCLFHLTPSRAHHRLCHPLFFPRSVFPFPVKTLSPEPQRCRMGSNCWKKNHYLGTSSTLSNLLGAAADLGRLPALFFSLLTANQPSISWRATCGIKKKENHGSEHKCLCAC